MIFNKTSRRHSGEVLRKKSRKMQLRRQGGVFSANAEPGQVKTLK